jgi:lipopolysaccharide export system protein LptA
VGPLVGVAILALVPFGAQATPASSKPAQQKPTRAPTPKATPKPSTPAKEEDRALFDFKENNEPTYITADSLSLDTQNRTFVYTGNVKVIQADMTLTSELLEGKYSQENKIQELVARKNVVITKGPSIKATSNRAVYDASKELVTLLENPQLYQNGTILTAERVKVYLRDNRSTAEGQVRMKLVKSTQDAVSSSAKKDQ